MKKLINFILKMLSCQMGATYYSDNYTAQWITKPSSKFPKGEVAGKVRTLIDRFTLVDSTGLLGLDAADVIYGPKIPPSSIVVDAYLHINKSLGATGIFDLGFLANGVDSADSDAFVSDCDGGGQAALRRAQYNTGDSEVPPGILKRFTKETQIVATCTEVMDDTVTDAVLTMVVFYVND